MYELFYLRNFFQTTVSFTLFVSIFDGTLFSRCRNLLSPLTRFLSDYNYGGILIWGVAVSNLARIVVVVTQKFRDFLYYLRSYYPGSSLVVRVKHQLCQTANNILHSYRLCVGNEQRVGVGRMFRSVTLIR